jgi:PAS domain S-box-containing protein
MLFDTTFVGRSSEDALAFIVEILQSSTEYSLIGKGLDGKTLLWNEGARRMYGYEADEILGTAASDILHPPEDIAARLPRVMMEESLRQGKWEGVLTRVRKNGQRFLARAAMTPRFDAAGKHTGYLLISKDITNDIALAEDLSLKTGELRTTNERLSALVDLNLHLGSELDLQRLLQSFGHAAREIVGARYAVTGIVNADGSRLQSLYADGMDAGTAARLGSPNPQSGVLRTVLREGQCVRVRNPGGDPAALGFAASRPPIHAWLGAPIASPTRIYGYIGLIDKVGLDEFSKEDERLAGILAAQVGRIYQNASLYAEVLRRASELEQEMSARQRTEKALAERVREGLLAGEVGAALTRSYTLKGMLQLCAEALVRHLDATFARIWAFNEAENILELKASAGLYTHIDGPHSRVPMDELKIGRIARERAPHLTNDVLNDPCVGDKEWAKRENLIAFAGYPLVVEDCLVGVVGMFARQPLNPATVAALGSVAHEIALGVERSRANDALRQREEHIRLLLDSTAEAIYGIDLQGRCSFANAACARLLGYTDPSQLLTRNMHDLMHHTRSDGSPCRAEECRIFQAFLQDQGSHVEDEVLWRVDGSSFPAEYWSHPIHCAGQVAGSVVTFLDITERRQLEEQFRKAQQRLRDVVVSSPAVLFTLALAADEVQSISWASDNLQEVLGHPPEVAIGPHWWLANVHPDDRGRVMSDTKADLFGRGHGTYEYRFRHGDGSYRWTRCDLRLIRDEAGRSSEAVGAWSDITERKRADEEQSKLREQLQQAQKLESVGRLAGGVAHDFNNLLTVINGYSDLSLKGLILGDPMRENIAEIRQAGQRATELVRQLLLLSRKQVTQASEVNLNDIITEVGKMLARVIGEDIRLEFALSPSLGWILADPGQLHQVLMNLAVNARDAMPGGGTLLIETANVDLEESYSQQHANVKPGPYVQLKVSDTGIGMTRDVISHIYEPFFSTKKAGEGTGLGLATVYGIVQQGGGSIWVYSEPGEGTTFTIYLPRIDAGLNLRQETEAEPDTLRGTETILVVEDQDQLRRMAGHVLRSYGYRVLEAANPGEALLHSERYAGPIHLLLTDVVMPGMTGPELAGRLKPLRKSMEVIFMSGYSERVVTDRLELASSYLQKPFSPEALAGKVRGVLGAPRLEGTILVVDDEPEVRGFLRKVLTGVSYHVLEAENGREAARQIESNEVDLVIMDLAMPEQEGIETIRALHQVRPRLKIIAISGQFAGPLLRAAELFGAQESLVKPIQPEDLLGAVARVMVGSSNGISE